ncbi:hypothetical protein, partial [Rhizobium sp. CCGE 510]|uniref:hypothetical protein n=1 Tax=Rhizobium sp. CCGE 510 TaxID=1132836 RepID=UPI00027B91D2
MAAYDEAYERACKALDSALMVMGRTVHRPSVIQTVMGEAYRYKEQSPEQALGGVDSWDSQESYDV